MSRIGKKPIDIPDGVTVKVDGQWLAAKGPKGELEITLVDDVIIKVEGASILVQARDDLKRSRAMWGMSRSLVNNVITGVSDGFERRLEIKGIGYRAQLHDKSVQLFLGFSHEVFYQIPEGITIACPRPNEIVITGIDKNQVGQCAADIRRFRPPDPYKGKGVRYAGEYIFMKEGKKK